MEIRVSADGSLAWAGRRTRCAIGRGGLKADKREGDGATPVGSWPLRRVLYRADRLAAPPATALPVASIAVDDGWCDDPGDPDYNRPVRLPYAGRHERLWRTDGLYDLLVVLGYNDDPVIADRGSAIFLHVASPDFSPTEGCVAVRLSELSALVRACTADDILVVEAATAP